MRLGQLARKYDVSQQQIITYLKEIKHSQDTFHSNSKLDDETEALVAKYFEISPEKEKDLSNETSQDIEQNTEEPDVADINETKEVSPSDPEKPSSIAEVEQPQIKDEVAIETDQLLELLESEDSPIDLDKITLIKAPKKELDGLKVVGKIELPEQKVKTEEETEQPDKDPKPDSNRRQRRRLVSDEELEERRLKAKRKKEENEARQEERRKAKEKKRRKAVREAHYQQKMQQIMSGQAKITKSETQHLILEEEEEEPRPAPRTIFGKFWRWMNTP